VPEACCEFPLLGLCVCHSSSESECLLLWAAPCFLPSAAAALLCAPPEVHGGFSGCPQLQQQCRDTSSSRIRANMMAGP
jgi:hypothetical protein